MGRVAQSAEAWEDAVRYYQSVALLFDDPVYSPRALRLAADGLRRMGREEEAQRTLKELQERYPSAPAE
jgi:TolA-binding protein